MTDLKYEEIPRMSPEEIEAALARNDPEEILVAVLAAALYADEPVWAQRVCVSLTQHDNFIVRGNAILGFGHLARIHRALDREAVVPLIRAGLRDVHEYVRAQADIAADDVEHYLGWSLGPRPHEWR